MAAEMISWPISTKECCEARGSNPRPEYQSDAHPTKLSGLAFRPEDWPHSLNTSRMRIRPSYQARPSDQRIEPTTWRPVGRASDRSTRPSLQTRGSNPWPEYQMDAHLTELPGPSFRPEDRTHDLNTNWTHIRPSYQALPSDQRIEPTTWIPIGRASDRATRPGLQDN